ncbi:hypothetical protein BGZ95_004979 [Linnemannia exigua]|uniref:Lysozyme n=1 Tax=Linnemannia exigua TaxID=604196 RepID=A0AAD4DH09_9FUNG|nr:hypothetical protein BGZ95_004979 [Linnemannia exigua]
MDERKKMGMKALTLLGILTGLSIYLKRHKWAGLKTRKILYKSPSYFTLTAVADWDLATYILSCEDGDEESIVTTLKQVNDTKTIARDLQEHAWSLSVSNNMSPLREIKLKKLGTGSFFKDTNTERSRKIYYLNSRDARSRGGMAPKHYPAQKQTVDLQGARACIVDTLSPKVTLNANQYGALVSWAYSIGCDDVKTSDLVKRLNEHRESVNKVAEQELPKWSEDGELAVADPVSRRNDEVRLFNTGSFDDALPCKK